MGLPSYGHFNPRAPCGARPPDRRNPPAAPRNFNPRAPCGARLAFRYCSDHPCGFQSTRPVRGATQLFHLRFWIALFQSTRPVRGATRSACRWRRSRRHFNPRAPCGARRAATGGWQSILHFNPRAPCGARLQVIQHGIVLLGISIHAPRAGRDRQQFHPQAHQRDFNPRAPCGARRSTQRASGNFSHFNPRAPCGARRPPRTGRSSASRFQSTRPVRGATQSGADLPPLGQISIHAPRAGRDSAPTHLLGMSKMHFNPRAPCGARQQKYTKLLYTLLRQKAILRQFHAKRRLLKRFSTYKYRNTFLICSANRMGKICTLPLRTTRSLDLPEGMSACSQSARFCFRTFFPSSKTADYPALDP